MVRPTEVTCNTRPLVQWVANQEKGFRLAPRSGKPAMSFWESKAKLETRVGALEFKLDRVDRALAEESSAVATGPSLTRERDNLSRHMKRAHEDQLQHSKFSQHVRRLSRVRLRVGRTGREFDNTWANRPSNQDSDCIL